MVKEQTLVSILIFFALVAANTAYCQTDNFDTVMELLKKSIVPRGSAGSLGWQLSQRAQASLVVMGEDAVEDLLWIANDEDQKLRMKLFAIGALADMRSKQAVPTLIQLLDSQSKTMRWNAIECLGKIGTEEAVVALLAETRGDDLLNAHYAQKALKAVINPDATDELKKVLSDENTGLVSVAQWALANIPTKEAFEALTGTLSDKRSGVRRTAASVLGTAPAPEAIDFLKNAMEAGEESENVRLELALSLIKLGDKAAGKILHELAADGTEISVRRQAIDAIIAFADTSAIPLLEKLLSDNSTIRSLVVYALGELGDVSVVPALEKIAEHDRLEHLREAARTSIEKIEERTENN